MAGKQKSKKNPDWAEAQKFCRMSDEAIRMAKELGMTPRTLTSNHASTRSESWKAATEDWVRSLYEKRQVKAAQKAKRREKLAKATSTASMVEVNTLEAKPERLEDDKSKLTAKAQT